MNAIVLDWDGVVSNDVSVKNAIYDLLESCGITRPEAMALYQSTKDRNGFSPIGLAKGVAKITPHESGPILNAIQEITKNSREHLFPDALEFINNLPESGWELLILTAGDQETQSAKVAGSDVKHHFHDVHIVEVENAAANKSDVLQKSVEKYDRIYFYDDKLVTIMHMHEVFRDRPEIVPIWVDRVAARPLNTSGFIVESLSWNDLKQHEDLLNRPRTLCAAARIVGDNDKLLMVEEGGNSQGKWTIPIGHVDPNETFMSAVVRETSEETGYTISLHEIKDFIVIDGAEYGGSKYDQTRSIIIACFDATIVDKISDQTDLASKWLSKDEVSRLMLRGDWVKQLLSD